MTRGQITGKIKYLNFRYGSAMAKDDIETAKKCLRLIAEYENMLS